MIPFFRRSISLPPAPTLADLHSALRDEGMTPDSIAKLSDIGRRLYRDFPSLATFTARSVFRALANEFDDPQAVPTEHISPFVESLLPLLKQWTATDGDFNSVDTMSCVVMRLSECEHAAFE
jgi:hypothetical protein